MSPILVPSRGPADWRALLANPARQWQPQFSAWSLAHHWEAARGQFPTDVAEALVQSADPLIRGLEVLIAVPEHRTRLPGGGFPSHSDLFVLARGKRGTVAIVVEGTVQEAFGEFVGEWLAASPELKRAHERGVAGPDVTNRSRRMAGICRLLELNIMPPWTVRYQLLHRTAAAVLEARRFGASAAVMLVQSFDSGHAWFGDYAAFCALFGAAAERNVVNRIATLEGGLPLFTGWVSSPFPADPGAG